MMDSALDILRRMRHLRPAFELREKWHYNNLVCLNSRSLLPLSGLLDYLDVYSHVSCDCSLFRDPIFPVP